MTLRNEDFTDRELLLLMMDVADADHDGVVTADDVAEALGYDEGSGYRVSPRLSWMTRYGFLARNGRGWVITEAGSEIAHGRLPQRMTEGLATMGVGARVLAMRALSQGYVAGNDWQAAAVRREWLHQAAKRR